MFGGSMSRIAPIVSRMADGSDITVTLDHSATDGLVSGLRSFADDHGGAKAVIEYVGRRGARIVLVGQDGVVADRFASGTDVAREACAEAGVTVETSWEQDLGEQIRPRNDLWRSMGRRLLAR